MSNGSGNGGGLNTPRSLALSNTGNGGGNSVDEDESEVVGIRLGVVRILLAECNEFDLSRWRCS